MKGGDPGIDAQPPPRLRDRHLIDAHKLVTGLAVLALIDAFGRWSSITLWVYLGLHGSYGILWLFKSRTFPDRSWERPAGPLRALVVLGGLTLYWIAPLLIYLAFALLALHWAPLLVLTLFVAVERLPNMRRKDRSLARYPAFEAYRRRTKLWIPGLL